MKKETQLKISNSRNPILIHFLINHFKMATRNKNAPVSSTYGNVSNTLHSFILKCSLFYVKCLSLNKNNINPFLPVFYDYELVPKELFSCPDQQDERLNKPRIKNIMDDSQTQ